MGAGWGCGLGRVGVGGVGGNLTGDKLISFG